MTESGNLLQTHASSYTNMNVETATIPYPRNGVERLLATLTRAMFRYWREPDGADCFSWVNDVFARMCGVDPELLAKTAAPLWNRIQPNDLETLAGSFRESALSLKPLRARFRLHGQGEDERWFILSAIPAQVGMDGVVEWWGILTGVVAQRAERDEGDGDSLPRLMMEFSRDGLMVLDMDGRVREVNVSMSRMLGYSRDELRRMHLWNFEAQWSRDELINRIRAKDLDDILFETVIRRKDGVAIDVEVSRTVVDWRGERLLYENIRDITERKQAESASYEQLLFLQQLLDTIPIPVFYKNCAGLYLGCNKAFETFTALPRERIIGKTVFDLLPKKMADACHESDTALYRRPGVQVYENVIQDGAGERRDVIFSKATFVDANGVVSGIVGAAMDITERKTLEAQFNQAQKMEAVGQLAGGIAHDFNNTLTAIIGFANIVEMKAGADSPLVLFVNRITQAAERAAALTKDLLAFSRKREMHLRPLDLDEVLASSRGLMTRIIREDIRLAVSRSEHPLTILADVSQLIQVLLNLTANARDAMPRGGLITVATFPFAMDREYVARHGYGKPGRYALITFCDTGCGMDETTRERIFEPFFTTKEVGKGTGLGLASVYGIIRQLEGFITVDSEPGKGTVFRIYLPEISEVSGPEEKVGRDAPVRGGNEAVLLAEDDPVVREMEESILMDAGYTVITANDGAEALEVFREKGGEVDLLVLDAIMPGKNGIEVLREAMAMRPDVSAIMMSGYTSEIMVMNEFIRSGVKFVQKPVNPRQFLATVRDVLDRRARMLTYQVKK